MRTMDPYGEVCGGGIPDFEAEGDVWRIVSDGTGWECAVSFIVGDVVRGKGSACCGGLQGKPDVEEA
jgi:hypothetical protein